MPDEIALLPAHEVALRLSRGELSSVELVLELIARIRRLDGRLGAFLAVLEREARAEAASRDAERAAGRVRGVLHGIPVGIKDLIDVEGAATTCGSRLLARNVARADATVVRRLREAGCVILGKLHLTEFAMMGYADGLPMPVNPWNPERSPMGSSSGSGVAVAAGLCFGALGTDTGGSIRGPAAANGVVGLKPTWGRVSRHGVFALAPSLDHVGPMARSVADAAAMLDAMAGFDPEDPTTLRDVAPRCIESLDGGVSGLRVGLDEAYVTTGAAPETAAACLAAVETLRGLGAEIVRVTMPPVDAAVAAWAPLCTAEALAVHAHSWPARAAEYGASFASVLSFGERVSAVDVVRAHAARLEFSGRLRGVFEQADVLACPSGPIEAVPASLLPRDVPFTTATAAFLRFTAPFDLSGSPTLSLPCGRSGDGLLHSLQLVARHADEATLCRVGMAYERATAWHRLHPAP